MGVSSPNEELDPRWLGTAAGVAEVLARVSRTASARTFNKMGPLSSRE